MAVGSACTQHAALPSACARVGAGGGRLSLSKLERLSDCLLTLTVSHHDGGRIEILSNNAARADGFARALLLQQPPSYRAPHDFDVSCYGWLAADAGASRRFCAALAAANERYDAVVDRARRVGPERAGRAFGGGGGGGGGAGGGGDDEGGDGAGDRSGRSPLTLSSEQARELTRWLGELGLETHAAALIAQGVSLSAPLGLTDDDLSAIGIVDATERQRIAEGHASQVRLRSLREQLTQSEARAERLLVRLADAEARASTEAHAAKAATGALQEMTAALAKEHDETTVLRRRGVQLDARIANDAARQRELEKRVDHFLGDADELIESTAHLNQTLRSAFYDHRKQIEQRTVQCISRFTGEHTSASGLAPHVRLGLRAFAHGTPLGHTPPHTGRPPASPTAQLGLLAPGSARSSRSSASGAASAVGALRPRSAASVSGDAGGRSPTTAPQR